MFTRFSYVTLVTLGISFLGLDSQAFAAVIVRPISAVASSQYEAARNPDNTRDESGLSFALNTNDPIPVVYPTHDANYLNMWLSSAADSAGNPTITFDLGAVYDLAGLHVWNQNEGSSTRGIRNVDVSFSTTSAVAGFGSTQTFSGVSEFAKAAGLTTYTGEDKLFTGLPKTAQWVRFTINDNWGDTFTGLSEVRFFTYDAPPPAPAPEPSTLVLAVLSLGGITLVRRRRSALGNSNS